MDETDRLLASAANAKRLRRAVAQLEQGKGIERPLIDIHAGYERTTKRFPNILRKLAE